MPARPQGSLWEKSVDGSCWNCLHAAARCSAPWRSGMKFELMRISSARSSGTVGTGGTHIRSSCARQLELQIFAYAACVSGHGADPLR